LVRTPVFSPIIFKKWYLGSYKEFSISKVSIRSDFQPKTSLAEVKNRRIYSTRKNKKNKIHIIVKSAIQNETIKRKTYRVTIV